LASIGYNITKERLWKKPFYSLLVSNLLVILASSIPSLPQAQGSTRVHAVPVVLARSSLLLLPSLPLLASLETAL
jgi:hypothetical protein